MSGKWIKRVAPALVLCGLALTAAPAAAQQGAGNKASAAAEAAQKARDEALEELRSRPYFSDFDENVPIQALYADWPPAELVERPYRLPWAALSFQRAGLFGRPIVVIVTVEWSRAAQRMEREVLAHPKVLRLLNEKFITVRVDADRRPDLRERYQIGSWPAIHFLLPTGDPMLSQVNSPEDRAPITAGVIDAERLAFVLEEAAKYWELFQGDLLKAGADWTRTRQPEAPEKGGIGVQTADTLVRLLMGNADRREGGFGPPPRYLPAALGDAAALRLDRGRDDLWKHANRTWTTFLDSPLHDREEGGLHRLALAPGFASLQYEKLLRTNLEWVRQLGLNARRDPEAQAARTALSAGVNWLLASLDAPEGTFFNGQVADPNSPDGGGYWRASPRDASAQPPPTPLVLTSTTALAGAELIRAGALMGERGWVDRGRAALDIVVAKALRQGLGARHVLQPVLSSDREYLGTQADVAFALLDGYQLTGEAAWLDAANSIAEFALYNLRDATTFRDRLPRGDDIGQLRIVQRPFLANVRMARVLIRLEHLGVRDDGRRVAREILEGYGGDLQGYGAFALEAIAAIEELTRPPAIVTVSGGGTRADGLRQAAATSPRIWAIVRSADGGEPGAEVQVGETVQRVTRPEAVVLALNPPVATN